MSRVRILQHKVNGGTKGQAENWEEINLIDIKVLNKMLDRKDMQRCQTDFCMRGHSILWLKILAKKEGTHKHNSCFA